MEKGDNVDDNETAENKKEGNSGFLTAKFWLTSKARAATLATMLTSVGLVGGDTFGDDVHMWFDPDVVYLKVDIKNLRAGRGSHCSVQLSIQEQLNKHITEGGQAATITVKELDSGIECHMQHLPRPPVSIPQ